MTHVTRIDPDRATLARTIADGLLHDLEAGRIKAIGRDQVAASIDARKLDIQAHEREDLIGLVCRKIVSRI